MINAKKRVFQESKSKDLRRVLLINWYGFKNEIIPISSSIMLVNGANASGKTTALDGIKYGLFGDTVFNAASEGGGKARSIYTTTRGLKTQGGNDYARDPENFPYVYSHIAAEFEDYEKNAFFVLDTMIVTDPKNDTKTYRVVFENARIEDIAFYEERDGKKALYDKEQFASVNSCVLLKPTVGVEKFCNMMGLRLDAGNINNYVSRLRGLIAYDPKKDVPSLIKDCVLEPMKANITRLKEAKEQYEAQGKVLNDLREENALLDEIIDAYREYVYHDGRVTRAYIKRDYRDLVAAEDKYQKLGDEIDSLYRKKASLEKETSRLNGARREANDHLADAKARLRGEESAFRIEGQRSVVERCKEDLCEAEKAMRFLDAFSPKLKNGLDFVSVSSGDAKRVLEDVCCTDISDEEKWKALKGIKEQTEVNVDTYEQSRAEKLIERRDIIEARNELRKELEDIQKHIHVPKRALPYMELRDEINSTLSDMGRSPSAKMAFELVESVVDESWRPVIENQLGDDRFCVIVPEEDYDAAYRVQMSLPGSRGKLVATEYLARRDVDVKEGYLASMLRVPNAIARKYFASLLDFVMADKEHVKDYARAVSMDGFRKRPLYTDYIDLSKAGRYCLGYESRKLAADEIRSDIEHLNRREREIQEGLDYARHMLEGLSSLRDALVVLLDGGVDLSAKIAFERAEARLDEEIARLKEMEDALENNPKVKELKANVDAARRALDEVDDMIRSVAEEIGGTNRAIEDVIGERDEIELKLDGDEAADEESLMKGLRTVVEEWRLSRPDETEQAVKEYDEFLVTGNKDYDVVALRTIRTYAQKRSEANERLRERQHFYGFNFNKFGEGHENIEPYMERKERIEVKDLEDVLVVYNKRKKSCFDTFNTEFLLAIRSHVDEGKREIRLLNSELKKLEFPMRYKIEVSEKQDGSIFATILQQSKKQALRGDAYVRNQMDIFDEVSLGDEEFLTEKEMSDLIEKILSGDDFSEFEDYRNYLDYDVIIEGGGYEEGTRLSRQGGSNSGAERQIPYIIILTCGLLNIYNKRPSAARLLFMDEPFEKLDATNMNIAIDFFAEHNLQVIFVAGNKTGEIGEKCDLIVSVVGKKDAVDSRIGKVERVS